MYFSWKNEDTRSQKFLEMHIIDLPKECSTLKATLLAQRWLCRACHGRMLWNTKYHQHIWLFIKLVYNSKISSSNVTDNILHSQRQRTCQTSFTPLADNAWWRMSWSNQSTWQVYFKNHVYIISDWQGIWVPNSSDFQSRNSEKHVVFNK